DQFPAGQQAIWSSSTIAQSFLVSGSNVTFSSISLKLQVVGLARGSLTGPVTVAIVPDSVTGTTGTPTPTTPNVSTITASGSVDASTLGNSNNAPAFYSF